MNSSLSLKAIMQARLQCCMAAGARPNGLPCVCFWNGCVAQRLVSCMTRRENPCSAALRDISISHTRGFALLAHSLRVPVGVDVELVGRNVVTVARRFVNEESRLSLPCGDINAGMLAYWCACEAIFKVVGDVGGTYKDNLFVKPFELSGHGRIVVSLKGLDTCCERDFFVDYINDGKLLIALCRE